MLAAACCGSGVVCVVRARLLGMSVVAVLQSSVSFLVTCSAITGCGRGHKPLSTVTRAGAAQAGREAALVEVNGVQTSVRTFGHLPLHIVYHGCVGMKLCCCARPPQTVSPTLC